MNKTISILVLEYFQNHPNEDLEHGPVVDWVEKNYLKLYNKKPRDTWRAIRKLHQEGKLIKVKKGIYRYDPDTLVERVIEEFTAVQKKAILERDGNKCVICGKGIKEGIELHVDHIKPKELGGTADIDNGQTLCSQHNLIKKTLKQTETGKKMFIRLYNLAKKEKNKSLVRFCSDILKTFEKYDINSHIEWKK